MATHTPRIEQAPPAPKTPLGYTWTCATHLRIQQRFMSDKCDYCLISVYGGSAELYAGAYFFRVGALGACPRCARPMDSAPGCMMFEENTEATIADSLCGWVEQLHGHNAMEFVRDLSKIVGKMTKGAPIPPLCPKPGKLPPAKMLVCGWCADRCRGGIFGWWPWSCNRCGSVVMCPACPENRDFCVWCRA